MIDLNNNRKCTVCGGITDMIIKDTGDFHCNCKVKFTPKIPEAVRVKARLIKQATELGFFTTKVSRPQREDKDWYYLWLCELQKWLRDNHDLIVYPTPIIGTDNKTFFMHCTWGLGASGMSETYELSLQEGLKDALKLITKLK